MPSRNPASEKRLSAAAIALALLATAGCSTLGERERPASPRAVASVDSLDPRLADLIQDDAMTAFGLMTHRTLLSLRTRRLVADRKFAPGKMPTIEEGWFTRHGAKEAVLGMSVFLSAFSYAKKPEASSGSHRFAQWFAHLVTQRFPNMHVSGVASAGISLAGAYGSIQAIANPVFEGDKARTTADIFQLVFRRGELRDAANARADLANAAIQAAFVADLKHVAAQIADRTARFLNLSARDHAAFATRIERRALEAFRADKPWKRAEDARIDVFRVLRDVSFEAEDRVKVAELLWDEAEQPKTLPLKTPADVRTWFAEMESAAKRLEADVDLDMAAATADPDPRLKEAAREYARLRSDIAEFREALALHRRVAEGSATESRGE